jgi:hypothetical protein
MMTEEENTRNGEDASEESSTEDEYEEDYGEELDSEGNPRDEGSRLPIEGLKARSKRRRHSGYRKPPRMVDFSTSTP